MKISDISLPEVYKESADFRFFCTWFELALSRIQYDTENLVDLYDPLRCPDHLLWMLGDTIGFKYDDRLPTAFNRLVLLYFMSMIRNKGSKDGVTLAAEVNLAQFSILNYGKEKDILYSRLEDTSIPVNAVYVTPHTSEGYIDVVYFSAHCPVDACIEYVRPLGMYLFQHAGVRYDSKTKLSIDARLTNSNDLGMSIGPTHVGHYRREDYARMQKTQDNRIDEAHTRSDVWYRNSEAEDGTDSSIDPGYRALHALQLANNEHIVKSLIDPIFNLGARYTHRPPDDVLLQPIELRPGENPTELLYNRTLEEGLKDISLGAQQVPNIGYPIYQPDVYTVDKERTEVDPHVRYPRKPVPAVNRPMVHIGDAISLNDDNTKYTAIHHSGSGHITIVDTSE